MTGQRHGDWLVLCKSGNTPRGAALWLCRCDCGVERPVIGADLRGGRSKNCGCKKAVTAKSINLRHGESGTRLYNIWRLMRARCSDRSDNRYGGNGIKVCKQWLKYEDFRDWAISNGYRDDLTIDRVDNNKGYYPQNCRWADYKTQSRNRGFVALTSEGRPGPEVAEENGIPVRTYNVRRSAGWSVDEAATAPYGKRRSFPPRSSSGKFMKV